MYLKDLAITSLETITVFDVNTGNYRFTLDELQSASIANAQEKTDITGKAGRKLSSLKRNKAVTVSGTNGLVSGGLLEAQLGSEFKSGVEAEVLWTDYITVTNASAETKYTAIGTAGSEIIDLFVRNEDGTVGAKLTQDAAAAEGKFAYDPASKKLTFAEGVEGEIVVYYKRKIKADTLDNYSDKYSDKVAMYIDALAEDKCANVYHVQIYIPKADFSGEFSLEMGENQTVHAFEAEALAGACGAAGQFYTYTVFGEGESDVAAQ